MVCEQFPEATTALEASGIQRTYSGILTTVYIQWCTSDSNLISIEIIITPLTIHIVLRVFFSHIKGPLPCLGSGFSHIKGPLPWSVSGFFHIKGPLPCSGSGFSYKGSIDLVQGVDSLI